ncbi:Sulfatase [Hexamita inflata]|uniref:Sulfatase n=1 Tax=Hexamita inflata TaxID=28002 RepID=A0AA86TNZ3_9EUKA|nr:Sulfatase [Hexamita inflata]CAI9918399.1 Sulfatase [Hexamita inflata]
MLNSGNKKSYSSRMDSKLYVISFIMQLFPSYYRYFGHTMQLTYMSYSRWNFVPHICLLICENVSMHALHQFLYRILPHTFWTRCALDSFGMVLQLSHLGISILDIMFGYGLLMRYGADLPYGYYITQSPDLFDTSLPNEGVKYPGSISKSFALHCLEAQKLQLGIIFGWVAFVFLLIFARLVVVFAKSFCLTNSGPKQTQKAPKRTRFISLLTVLLFVFYLFTFNGNKLDDVVPAHWYLYRTNIRQQMPQKMYLNQVRKLREKFVLPQGEEWLDQRQVPVYPLVHAPKVYADAYNKQIYQEVNQTTNEKLPNIVFLFWESFTPAPKYIEDEVLMNEAKYVDRQPYRKKYLPKLAELAEAGHTFLGVRSNGIPTINGWHSFVSGEVSSFTGINMIQSQYNAMDDFPSKFRQQGYHSMIVWPNTFKTDQSQNYVFRGKKQVSGPEFLSKYPTIFDEIHSFYPSKEEAELMGIEDYPKEQNYWTNDRVSSQQFNYLFNKNVQTGEKPVVAFYGNIDTHEDFNGFDEDKQYENFTFGQGRSNLYDVYGRHDAYSTVLKYSDAQFGRIYDNIKANAPETIVVIVGDHASRQVPLYMDENKKIDEDSEYFFDLNCNDTVMGGGIAFSCLLCEQLYIKIFCHFQCG